MTTVYSKPIEDFLNYLREAESQYSMAIADEDDCSGEMQDLLHQLELLDHTYHEYAQLAKDVAEVRKRRRKAKDTSSTLLPVLEWLDANKNCVRSLEQLLGAVRKAERSTESRIYIPRSKGKGKGK